MMINQAQYYKFKNILHTLLLLAAMLMLLGFIGWLIAGIIGMIWALSSGLFLLLMIPVLSSKFILYLYHARPMPPSELTDIIMWLTKRSHLKYLPGIYYLPSGAMLAFSTGFQSEQSIAISDGMLHYLNRRELVAVLAHEISHLKNHDLWVMIVADVLSRITSIMALVGYLMLILYLPAKLLSGQELPWLLLLILILAPNVSALLQLALSRTREFTADAQAIELTGDPEALISALTKMNQYEKHWLKKMLLPGYKHPQPSLLRTHPLTEERVKRLRQLKQSPTHHFNKDTFYNIANKENKRRPRQRFTGLWH